MTKLLNVYPCRGSLEFALLSKRETREDTHPLVVLLPVSAGLKSQVRLSDGYPVAVSSNLTLGIFTSINGEILIVFLSLGEEKEKNIDS